MYALVWSFLRADPDLFCKEVGFPAADPANGALLRFILFLESVTKIEGDLLDIGRTTPTSERLAGEFLSGMLCIKSIAELYVFYVFLLQTRAPTNGGVLVVRYFNAL